MYKLYFVVVVVWLFEIVGVFLFFILHVYHSVAYERMNKEIAMYDEDLDNLIFRISINRLQISIFTNPD